MKSQVIHGCRTVFALVVAVAMAVSLVPLPERLAFADEGSLVANQSLVEAADADAASESDEPVVKYSGVAVEARGKVQGSGWGSWVGSGATIGVPGGKGLTAVRLALTGVQGMSGSIYYQTYKRGSGWKKLAANGKATSTVRNVEAVKVRLTGDVANHYDVLYRTYVSGKGWLPWVKNNVKAGSGAIGKKLRVQALQVKLSPKTEEAAGKSVNRVGIRYEARFKATGWQPWKGDGKVAGKASGSKVLNGFALSGDAGSLSGGVKYRAYNEGVKWSAWKTSGFVGKASKRLEAMQIKLTGDLAQSYDVYYRAYCQSAGWLDWAKNGATAGSTGFNLRLQAFQVKLVRKGADAPGETRFPTVNLMEKSSTLDGIDISSWQSDINIGKVPADFVIVKSTQGNWYTNPYYRAQADATLNSGKLLGIYHYADLSASANAQAKYFVKSVKPYLGKAVLVLDYEADILTVDNTVAWARKFMNYVYKKTGVKPLIYINQSTSWNYNWSSVAKKYKLWLAQYLYANMNSEGYLGEVSHWDVGYWGTTTMYQYSSTAHLSGYDGRLDVNKFYGSVLSWKKLSRKN